MNNLSAFHFRVPILTHAPAEEAGGSDPAQIQTQCPELILLAVLQPPELSLRLRSTPGAGRQGDLPKECLEQAGRAAPLILSM